VAVAVHNRKKMIEIISADGCPHCQNAEEYLQRKGVPFKKIDAANLTPEQGEEIVRKYGVAAVPILCNDKGHCTMGFRPKEIDQLIEEEE